MVSGVDQRPTVIIKPKYHKQKTRMIGIYGNMQITVNQKSKKTKQSKKGTDGRKVIV